MHFQIEVPAPSHVGVMQPPTGVQKRERVLCLPLAWSALPCRLTRHSALGTVRLCTVGSAQLALHDWLYTVGSARSELPNAAQRLPDATHGLPSNAVRNCSNAALNAARCNLRVVRISFKHVYGLTVGAIKYGMQVICIKQVRAHGRSKQAPNAANYCCQTYAVLGMLRQTQLSAYCQNICSSRNATTNAALGILPDICSSRNTAIHAALGLLPDICSSRNATTNAALGILPDHISRHTTRSYVVLGILRHMQLSAYYQNLPLVHTTGETTATNLERKRFDSASSRL
ncbi:hypothetical protein Acr_11g0000980 [Actinidia rufa]|uniref:Uncharacterized protein n=1 Tax=Actinidia rufa TaxID=165716 RepID=A0A7J0FAR3_9ERIC|nr:hypothetical protein Acr_11g0000980 [Actinidia rufa]